MGNDGEFAEMGQERDRAARGTIGIKGGVCRVGSWVIRCPGAGQRMRTGFPEGWRQRGVCPAAESVNDFETLCESG